MTVVNHFAHAASRNTVTDVYQLNDL